MKISFDSTQKIITIKDSCNLNDLLKFIKNNVAEDDYDNWAIEGMISSIPIYPFNPTTYEPPIILPYPTCLINKTLSNE